MDKKEKVIAETQTEQTPKKLINWKTAVKIGGVILFGSITFIVGILIYKKGREDGYEEGGWDGYADGYSDGLSNGFEIGYDTGYDIGHDEGIEDSFESGYDNSDYESA